MLQLDHLILRVADPAASVRFYRQILSLEHESAPSFEVLRINEDCVIDLLAEAPTETVHLAFSLGRQGVRNRARTAAGVRGRLRQRCLHPRRPRGTAIRRTRVGRRVVLPRPGPPQH
jgi:catechol 2,3-dioxygenase-like lactoylglutathione lyase family enzyme